MAYTAGRVIYRNPVDTYRNDERKKEMKKIICMILTGLLALTCCTGLTAAPAFAGSAEWNIGNGRITETVTALVIDSAEVDVILKTGKDGEILIEETSSAELSEDSKVRWQLDGTTLFLKYENQFWNIFSFLLGDTDRTLTVTVPEDLVLDILEVDVASANITTDPLQAVTAEFDASSGDMDITLKGNMKKASFDSSSGNISASLENADQVQADASSGNISITMNSAEEVYCDTSSGGISLALETAGQVKTDASSGNISIALETAEQIKADTSSGRVSIAFNSADQVSVDTASGGVTLTVPEDADITLSYSSASGDLTSQLAMAMDGRSYISGSGAGKVSISTASGDLSILLAEQN